MNKLVLLLFFANSAAFAQESSLATIPLREGEALLANGDFVKALESCRTGLKNLGSNYTAPDTIDETGMKLIAAKVQEKNGEFGNAALVTCRILRIRFELWETKRRKLEPSSVVNLDAQRRAE